MALNGGIRVVVAVIGGWFLAAGETVPPRLHVDKSKEGFRAVVRRMLPSRTAELAPPAVWTLTPLSAEEWPGQRAGAEYKAPLAGVHREIGAEAAGVGRWDWVGPGRPVWRLAIESVGAFGVRLHFTDFHVGRGRVWIHDGTGEQEQIFGPYAGDGLWGDGEFWSDVVVGERVVVEYEPADGAPVAELPFRFGRIGHLVRGVVDASPEAAGKSRAASAAGGARQVGNCHLDVTCYPEWQETSRAVGWMVFETGEGSAVCTGTLLNTRGGSGVPYFLTADHCVSSDREARSLMTFWFYQSASCNAAPPDPRTLPRTLGARYLVGKPFVEGDSSLLRLNDVPSGVMFSGWTTDTLSQGQTVVGVSHPAGSYKRISAGQVAPRARFAGMNAKDEDFYGVRYSTQGLVEPGSSGSGLFAAPGVLAGMLSHGAKPTQQYDNVYCDMLPFVVNYGRFTSSYALFRDYLEDRTTGTAPPPTAQVTELRSGVAATVNAAAVSSPTLLGGSNAYRLTIPAGASRVDIRLAIASTAADVVLFARYGALPTVSGGNVTADYVVDTPGGNKSLAITPASNPALRAGDLFIALGVRSTGVALAGTLTATVTVGTPPPADGGRNLTSGTAVNFTLGRVTGSTLFSGEFGYRITVPQGATRLEIRLTTARADIDVDLYARFGQDVTLQGGQVVADHRSDGPTGNETIVVTATSSPALRAGTYFIGFGLFTAGVDANCTLVATVTGGSTTPGPGTARTLVSGQAMQFSFAPVTGPTLFNGVNSYQITVPEGATRLEVAVRTAGSADVDLYVRFGADPVVQSGQVVADHRSEDPTGNETLAITAASSPPLRAGVYFISLVVFTPGVAATGTVTATVATGTAPPAGNVLVSGQPRTFTLPAASSATLYNGENGFRIEVPAGATRLDVRLESTRTDVDVDMFIRFGADPVVVGGRVVADYTSEGPSTDEFISISAASSPPLRAGTYHIAFGQFTRDVAVPLTVTATVTMGGAPPPQSGPVTLTPGRAQTFRLGPVTSPTLFSGANGYIVNVPAGATRLEIQLETDNPDADVDLYARFGRDVALEGGRVVADATSTGPAGVEKIVVTGSALRTGQWYIALGLFTTSLPVTCSLTATVAGEPAPEPSEPRRLTPGVPASFRIGPVSSPTLFSGGAGFVVEVPEGATRLDLRLSTTTPGADVDLYVRNGEDVGLADGRPVADHLSEGPTGAEVITITAASDPPLRPGLYYAGLGLFTPDVEAVGSITAVVTTAGSAPRPPAAATVLTSGVPAKFALPAVDQPTLYSGEYSFRINVPEGSSRLTVRLASDVPVVDTDLYVRFNSDVDLADGEVVADWGATTDSGNEQIVITAASDPPLRAGTYYISLVLYTTGAQASGTVTATIERASVAPPISASRVLTSGVPAQFALPAVTGPTFFGGEYGFRIVVPAGAEALEIALNSDPASADVDLAVRYGQEVGLADGRIIADHTAVTESGSERLVIDLSSSPPLRAGVYYIALPLYTPGVAVRGTITATIRGGGFSQKGGLGEDRSLRAKLAPAVAAPLEYTAKREAEGMVSGIRKARPLKKPVLTRRDR